MSIKWIGLASALCCAAPAAAAPPVEWIGQAPLPELEIGHQLAGQGSLIVERIPAGETVERWTRMVLVQRFAGVIARGGTLDEWHGHFMQGIEGACPGFRGGPPTRLRIGGRAAMEFRVDCPRNPATGLPESFFLRAVAGRADLHVAQIAFRSIPNPADTAWAIQHLASVTLCTRQNRTPICRAGPETIDR